MPPAHRHIGRASQCLLVDDVWQVSGESDSFVLLFVQEALLSEFPQHKWLGPAVRRHLDPGQYGSWSAHPHAILKGRLLGGTQPGLSRRGGAECQAVAQQMASERVWKPCFLLGATVNVLGSLVTPGTCCHSRTVSSPCTVSSVAGWLVCPRITLSTGFLSWPKPGPLLCWRRGVPRWKSLVFPLEPGQDPGCHSGPAVSEGIADRTVSPDPYLEALPPKRLCLELGLEGDAPREMRS